MKSDLEILQALIRDEALASVEHSTNRKTLILKESGNQKRSAYSLKIRNVPDDVIAFKADAFPAPNCIFKNGKGECKRADFVIVASDNRANWIVYIEMKSGKGHSEKETVQQLRGAQCLVAYCRAVGQEFWQEPKFLEKENYLQRFIRVRDIGAQKRPSIPPKSVQHDVPERMLKINAPPKNSLRFYQLVQRRRGRN